MKSYLSLSSVLKSAPAFVGCSMLAAGVLSLTSPASAAVVNCVAPTINKVTGTAQCQYSPNSAQDFLNTNPLTVNNEGFFGFTDWQFDGKIGVNGYGGGSGSGLGGPTTTWSIVGELAANYQDVMLIFKSGNNPLIGYLLNDGVTSGFWSAPTTDPPFSLPGSSTVQAVSHISVYYRGTPIPTPALLPGLIGLGVAAWRKRNADTAATDSEV